MHPPSIFSTHSTYYFPDQSSTLGMCVLWCAPPFKHSRQEAGRPSLCLFLNWHSFGGTVNKHSAQGVIIHTDDSQRRRCFPIWTLCGKQLTYHTGRTVCLCYKLWQKHKHEQWSLPRNWQQHGCSKKNNDTCKDIYLPYVKCCLEWNYPACYPRPCRPQMVFVVITRFPFVVCK